MGDSVPKHTGPNSLTDTSLEPSVSEPDRPPPERVTGDGSLFTREAQAACRFNCWASKSTPFFRIVKVMVAIFRAKVRRAIVGRIPFCRSPT